MADGALALAGAAGRLSRLRGGRVRAVRPAARAVHRRALVYVSSSREVDAGELSAAQKLADTCALLLSGDEAVSGAAARCGLAGTPDELRRGVSVTALGGTGVVRIEASAPSAEEAAAFANALAEGAPGLLAEVVGGGSAVTAAPARLPSRPDGPPAAACAGIAALCGAAMTLLVLCARGEPGGPPLVHGLAGEGAARLREYAGGERRLAVLGPGELRVACALAGEDARVLLLTGSERDGLSELLSGRCDPPDLLARGPVPGWTCCRWGRGPPPRRRRRSPPCCSGRRRGTGGCFSRSQRRGRPRCCRPGLW